MKARRVSTGDVSYLIINSGIGVFASIAVVLLPMKN